MSLRLGTKIGFTKEVDFAVLIVSWFLIASIFRTHRVNLGLFHAWVLLTSIISLFSLTAIGYFDHHIPKPEMSDVVSLLLVLPLSAFVAKWLLMLTSNIPPIRYTEAFRSSVWVALVFELAQIVIFRIHYVLGNKWSLMTHLDPEEMKLLQTQIESSGASWWIELRPYDPAATNGGRMRGDETLVISRKSVRYLKDHPELLTAHLRGQSIIDVRELLKEFRGRVNLNQTDGWTFLLGSTYHNFLLRAYFYTKGVIEGLFALVVMVLLSPLFLALSLGIFFTNGLPIFYRQERLGYGGKQFSLYKFRTMPNSAEDTGPKWASEDDPRASPFGRWLRKTRLDELPQLLNVVRGELSFVGPRPERPEFYKMLKDHIPLFSTRLLVRPGITGWAQLRQGYAASIEECKTKLEYDLYYVQNMSPSLDVQVMVNTAAMMVRGNSGR